MMPSYISQDDIQQQWDFEVFDRRKEHPLSPHIYHTPYWINFIPNMDR